MVEFTIEAEVKGNRLVLSIGDATLEYTGVQTGPFFSSLCDVFGVEMKNDESTEVMTLVRTVRYAGTRKAGR